MDSGIPNWYKIVTYNSCVNQQEREMEHTFPVRGFHGDLPTSNEV